jgi:hypothetical protein
MLLALGFPIALVLAWAFELTPEGIKRTEAVEGVTTQPSKNRAWIYVVIVAASLSVGLFFVGRYTAPKTTSRFESIAKSIAVLPFENLSRDPDNAYFADGIQEDSNGRLPTN